MEIIHTFGYRKYIFYSNKDLTKAYEIWVKPVSQDEFEEILGNLGIEFQYDI